LITYLKKLLSTSLFYYCCASAVNLPQLAPAGYNGMTPYEEKVAGQQFYAYMQARGNLVYDPLALDYINHLGFKLIAASNRPQQHFLFFIVKDSQINAFAGPGGYIGVNTGLILFAKTEGELAAVLAHEIAHVTQRHIAQSIEAANRGKIPATAAAIAGLLIGVPAISMGAIGASAQSQLNFTRAQEQDADHEGTKTLQRAGFDPNDMATMFDHMQRASYSNSSDQFEFLSTHPANKNRIARAQHQTSVMSTTKKHVSSLHFYLIQTHLSVELSGDPQKVLLFFEKNLKKNPHNLIYQYGYALALARNHHTKTALHAMQTVAAQDPDEIYFTLSLADLQNDSGNTQDALKILSEQIKFYPDYFPLTLQYATTLIKANQSKQAALFLKKHYREYDDNLLFLDLYQEALGKSGDMAGCYEARAKIYGLFYQPKMAIGQLELAQELPNLDKYQKASLEAQIRELNKQTK